MEIPVGNTQGKILKGCLGKRWEDEDVNVDATEIWEWRYCAADRAGYRVKMEEAMVDSPYKEMFHNNMILSN